MGEVSNRTLATLLVVAILISLGGTFVSLNKLGRGGVLFTGLATNHTTDLGYVTFNLTNFLSIEMLDANIDFGVGTVSDSALNLTADSETGVCTNDDFVGGVCGDNAPDMIVIKNDGSYDVNISLESDTNATGFLGGPSEALAAFNYSVAGGTETLCTEASVSVYTAVTSVGTPQQLCDDLNPGGTINVSALLLVPPDTEDTNSKATWNFTAICAAAACANDI